MMKKTRILCLALALTLLLGGAGYASDEGAALDRTAARVLQSVPAPQLGSVGGEWAVLGLARAGAVVPAGYYEGYYAALEDYVAACSGVLSARKYTEYTRVVLALTAIGRDPRSVAGFNLLRPLGDYEATVWQGAGGAAFALLALDSGGYEVPINGEAKTQATRALYIQGLLDSELEGGGFSLSQTADPDVTAVVLTALAPYAEQPEVSAALGRGLARLSAMQNDGGGFASGGTETCESAAQVLVALCTLGISPDDARFVKKGSTALDALLAFQVEGGFAHIPGGAADGMATEQALCALAAVKRAKAGEAALYDMRGASKAPVFSDVDGHENQIAIETLAAAGIVGGMGDGRFAPDETMTRAQFAAITVRALELSPAVTAAFSDVAADAWYAPFVGAAYESGIIRGVGGDRFEPGGTITVREAEIMLTRAAALCGLSWEEPAWFSDPDLITRCEIAQRLYDLLREAGRLG